MKEKLGFIVRNSFMIFFFLILSRNGIGGDLEIEFVTKNIENQGKIFVWAHHLAEENKELMKTFKNAKHNKSHTVQRIILGSKQVSPPYLILRPGEEFEISKAKDSPFTIGPRSSQNPMSIFVPKGKTRRYKLKVPERSPIHFCYWNNEIRTKPDILVLCQPHNFFSITDDKGIAEITDIPKGKWKFRFCHFADGVSLKNVSISTEVNDKQKRALKHGYFFAEVKDKQTTKIRIRYEERGNEKQKKNNEAKNEKVAGGKK